MTVSILVSGHAPHAHATVDAGSPSAPVRAVASAEIASLGPTSTGAGSPAPNASVISPPETAATAPSIALTARAAFAVDLTNQTELYAQNADTPLAPASTTKIVTALVLVDHASPDAKVTVQQDDTVDGTVYSHMGLQAGDVVSVRDLLAGMLLNSAGDAALALSRYVGEQLPDTTTTDPRQRFVNEMNRVAGQLGMTNSHFLDPDGRDAAGHVMSARDITRATAELFKHQLLQQLVATPTMTVSIGGPNPRRVTLYNTNELLGSPGVHGVKTGTTDAAEECLVIAIWRGNDRVISVVLGSSDRYGDTAKLLNYLDQQYRWVRLGRAGDMTALNSELESKGYSMAVTETVLLTAADSSQLHYVLTLSPSGNGSRWSAQGEVVFLIGSRPIWRLPVYAGDPFKGSG